MTKTISEYQEAVEQKFDDSFANMLPNKCISCSERATCGSFCETCCEGCQAGLGITTTE